MLSYHGQPILLEIAIASVEDALTAAAHGADRLELSAALELGGLTPSLGLLRAVVRSVPLPVLALIRPRPGGFAYSERALDVMRHDAALALENGAAGVVFGMLTPEGAVDVPRCREFLRGLTGVVVVFHRAFDVTPQPLAALEHLIDLGIPRVLTSGQEATALQGAPLLRALIGSAAGRIEILPAAGINAQTAPRLLAQTGCTQLHASLRHGVGDPSLAHRPALRLGGSVPPGEHAYAATSAAALAALRGAVEHCEPL